MLPFMIAPENRGVVILRELLLWKKLGIIFHRQCIIELSAIAKAAKYAGQYQHQQYLVEGLAQIPTPPSVHSRLGLSRT